MEKLQEFKARFEEKLIDYLKHTQDLQVHIPREIFPTNHPYYKDLNLDDSLQKLTRKNKLIEAMEYTMISKAKRLRPIIVYSTGSAVGAPLEVLDDIAICAEMTHVISLIYDDLPSFDNDDLRHGKPTCHIAFSESTAILTAYSMTYLSFEILSKLNLPSAKVVKISQTLASMTGVKGLALGELFDLESFSGKAHLNELIFTYYLKTAKLFAACALMGAYAGQDITQDQIVILERAVLKMGIAFQIQDDLRNYNETAESLGKNPNSDLLNEKPTIPEIIGLSAAIRMRDQLLNEFLDDLDQLPFDFSCLKEITTYFSGFTSHKELQIKNEH